MKKLYYALLVALAVQAPALVANCKAQGACGPCQKICKKTMEKACGELVLSESGMYCVTEDLVGCIVLDHDNICLDLGCHSLDPEGKPSAITASGKTNISISNGCVVNSSLAGIDIVACDDVTVTNIAFRDHVKIACRIQAESVGAGPEFEVVNPSTGITVCGCDFTDGNRALVLRGCQNGRVEKCDMYGNTNTDETEDETTSVFGVEFCECIDVKNVNVCNNIKAVLNQDTNRSGVFIVLASSDITLESCVTSNNFSEQVSSPNGSVGGFMAGLLVSGRFTNPAGGDFENLSQNIRVFNHSSNANRVVGARLSSMRIVSVIESQVIGCQTNGNVVEEGVVLNGLNVFESSQVVIRQHQANNNKNEEGSVIAVVVSSSSVVRIESSEATNNEAGTVTGFFLVRGLKSEVHNLA